MSDEWATPGTQTSVPAPIGLPEVPRSATSALPVDPVTGAAAAGSTLPQAPGARDDDGLGGEQYAAQPRLPQLLREPLARGTVAYLLLSLLVGALAAWPWKVLTTLPVYHLASDGSGVATTSERGLASFFSSDAWFCGLGVLVGLATGLLAWKWFHRIGWPVAVLAVVSATLACLTCWQVGELLGPTGFASRIASAQAGADVPIDFALHAHSALLVWPFFAIIPVLLFSSLGRDEEATPRRRHPAAGSSSDDDAGVTQEQEELAPPPQA